MHYLSQYQLSVSDARRLRLTDAYSMHRIVYGLFDDVRGGETNKASGILFADKGMKLGGAPRQNMRTVLILSDRQPREPDYGNIQTKPLPDSYLLADQYVFELVINPVRRKRISDKRGPIIPITGKPAVRQWFLEKSPGWGFETHEPSLQVVDIKVEQFLHKNGDGDTASIAQVTIAQATITGALHVTDRNAFIKSAYYGIGRAKAFGCGLLQITPIV